MVSLDLECKLIFINTYLHDNVIVQIEDVDGELTPLYYIKDTALRSTSIRYIYELIEFAVDNDIMDSDFEVIINLYKLCKKESN